MVRRRTFMTQSWRAVGALQSEESAISCARHEHPSSLYCRLCWWPFLLSLARAGKPSAAACVTMANWKRRLSKLRPKVHICWVPLAIRTAMRSGPSFSPRAWRWGTWSNATAWMRGYNQVYVLVMAEPIFRGPENFYYGISLAFVTTSSRPGRRWVSVCFRRRRARLDRQPRQYHRRARARISLSTLLSAAGISYQVNDN